MYKGYIRILVATLLMTLSGESRNSLYQRDVNPQRPPYFPKLRSVASCSVFCRAQSLCGILDHHLHGREDPPDWSRPDTYPLHLIITTLRGSTTYDSNVHMLLTKPGLAPMMNSTLPKLLKPYGSATLMTQYRGCDLDLRGFSISNHLSSIPANCLKHHRSKQPNISTSITIRTFVPQLLDLALLRLVLFIQVSFLALPIILTAQCLSTVTNLSSVELIDDDHSCNLDATCIQLLHSFCFIPIMDSCLMFYLSLLMLMVLGKPLYVAF
ncbi:PREDICTED: uncharacterized protein LOC104747754 [Camelina sativa]|uniref:Uncharacterized protein LOC104747754 n=1 Tax=Camelina sativa TaxID=90675 RepID=A0ABM0W9S2_CAMSA|nr:PREDICTED: uncharacterized protein LOC104747754 [Camelina sativa]